MSLLVEGINNQLKDIGAAHYFIAISAGKDSVALAHIVHSLGFPITLLHVNYHLRGDESNEDQRWIERFAKSIDVPLIIFDVKENNLDFSTGNLQHLARDIRYSFFEKERAKIKNSIILVGHQQSDQIENFWIHLFRNSGRSGLKGMSIRKGNVIRPMLTFHPDNITSYLKERNIVWREDSSNAKSVYLRNFIRNELMPFISKCHPNIEKSILLIQEKFKQAEVTDLAELDVFNQNHTTQFPLEKLNSFTDEKLLLFMKQFGLKGSQLESFRVFLSAQTGAQFEINTTHYFRKERNHIALVELNTSLNFPIITIEEVSSLPENFDKKTLFVDKNKIKGNISIRYWVQGDRISPIGVKGSKLISDVFSDAKISNTDKNNIPIIVDDDHILWCYGLCVDRRKIATNEIKEIIKITIQE
ncbi:MAG: tRNA lysidine(34) synthetase TilS [Bacteroidetes bacterium]|nr:tRNA lysidine(34) synthetase TilS [Bacteroidota bacterium]